MLLEQINSTNTYGFLAAGLTTIAFLPQLIRTYQTKSANDVSITTLIMFITGVMTWTIYGIRIHSLPVIIANLITFTLNVLILILKLIYRESTEN